MKPMQRSSVGVLERSFGIVDGPTLLAGTWSDITKHSTGAVTDTWEGIIVMPTSLSSAGQGGTPPKKHLFPAIYTNSLISLCAPQRPTLVTLGSRILHIPQETRRDDLESSESTSRPISVPGATLGP